MNARTYRMAIAAGISALIASCTATSETSNSSQQSQNLTQVSDAQITTVSTVKVDGSSTVYPITKAVAEDFRSSKESNKAQVTVNFSGTSGGFKKFCAGETDISNAFRPILTAEMAACNQNNVRYIELRVAFDALTIAVHPQNSWAKDISVAELKKIWKPGAEGKITSWKQVRSSWPDRPLKLYGAGKQSGTFDYFTEAIVGKAKASRTDYTASEDDEVLVQGVSKDPNALGYFGFAYYEANQSKLKVLAVDNGKGSVLPSRQTVEKVQYQPLSPGQTHHVNQVEKFRVY